MEIDPERVAAALPFERAGLSFVRGGFEVPVPGDAALPCLPAPRGQVDAGSGGRSGHSAGAPSPDGCAKGGGTDGGRARAVRARGGRRAGSPGGGSRTGGGQPEAGGGAPGGAAAAARVTAVGERRPLLIRAANVLRQYGESEVAPHWSRLCARLAPGGLLVEGTCDEIGRRHVWVALGPEGPRSVTFATRLGSLSAPSDLAERLPKALIHRNVPGEPIHAFLRDFDRAWATAAPYAALGARQRWMHSVRALSTDWPVLDGPRRWRQGELTVAWAALAPRY